MKKTVGIVEKVTIKGKTGEAEALALVDTGAKLTSVDIKLAAETGVGPIKRVTKIKSALNDKGIRRPVLEATVTIGGKEFNTEVNIADRKNMAFPVLIGRNILVGSFVVDPEKNSELFKTVAKKKKMFSEYE